MSTSPTVEQAPLGSRLHAYTREGCLTPAYNPKTYVSDLIAAPYFEALIELRDLIHHATHRHFREEVGARNVDLFMLTPSISSPMGPGSDSEPISVEFGGLKTHLVDSSQFGFEPLLMRSPGILYCYLPSMRGEEPDARHLNQFYHCEAELHGTLDDVMCLVEGYIHALARACIRERRAWELMSAAPERTLKALQVIEEQDAFPRLTFDEACHVLSQEPEPDRYVRTTLHGRDITSMGERRLAEIQGYVSPFWITYYDRDRVPFYQKPRVTNPDQVENADLIVPALTATSFAGEVAGCGQRQDRAEELYESMRRQDNLSPTPYEWYIDLRRHPEYRMTSGFGMGIERFLVWMLAKESIRDVSLYPRLKGVQTYP